MNATFLFVTGYFLGSIPFGYILVRIFKAQDIREIGSGNIGATNVARSSPVLGVLTLVLDGLKGFAAVMLARMWFPGQSEVAAGAAVAAIFGHMFPLWLRFRGGKGVATGLGSFALLAPKSILVMIGIFLAVVAATRYVSLGSLIALALLPVLAWKLDGQGNTSIVLASLASLLIVAKHHGNIRRLLAGTENKWRRS
jgi:glycerol-3-phosphate acyltransferase PlsY